MFKKIIVTILNFEARLVLRKFKPIVVAITGNVGKTSAKEAIATVLQSTATIRKSPKSYNSEVGIPLTILGFSTPWNSPLGWLLVMIRGLFVLFQKEYPRILVLEAGVDRPGDMDKLLSLVEPQVSVVTAIGEIPVHVEFFSGPKELAFEKGKLVRRTASDGYVVLNADDDVVRDMRREVRGKTITFGVGKGADVRISQYAITVEKDQAGREAPRGITCKADFKGSTVPVHLEGVFGKQQMYTIGAALAVAAYFGNNLVDASRALQAYKPLPGRLRLIEGLKDTWILDDTYNASPMAMHAALDTLKDLPATRRIAVLGDMLEIGKFTIPAHQTIGELTVPIVDLLFTVGPRAKFIAQEARARGMATDAVLEFRSSKEAGAHLQSILIAGDVVLVKGSQSMRMERVVEEVMAHPEEASHLLVRQEEFWKRKP